MLDWFGGRTWVGALVVMALFGSHLAMAGESLRVLRKPLLFVDNRNGDDLYSGEEPAFVGERNGPVRTVQTAVRRIGPGGTIVLLPTDFPYFGSVTIDGLTSQGIDGFPITIEGNGVEWFGESPAVTEMSALASMIGGATPPAASTGRFAPRAFDAKTADATIHSFRSYETAADRRAYYVRPQAAMVFHRASYWTVKNVRFRDFDLDAVQLRGPLRGIRFENCSFADNKRAGIAAYTNVQAEIVRCTFAQNRGAGVVARNFSKLQLIQTGNRDSRAVDQEPSCSLQVSGTPIERVTSGPFFVPEEFSSRRLLGK